LVNTQFQYLDVGVNIDITPHIHSEHEVTLKMTLEVSSVSGTQNIGGISQPIIGQRRIEHETRLQDGEVNLVGGILEDTETHSMSGYPWLTRLPVLKYLFGQDDKQRQENEIVFAITPHIVRAQEVTDDNLRLVDLGRGSTVTVGHSDPRRGTSPVRVPGTMEQTANPKAPNRTAPQKAVTPSAATPSAVTPSAAPARPEPSRVPPQIPSTATTTTLIRPVKATIEEQNLPAFRPSGQTQAQPSRPAKPPSNEAVADPCPYGMHSLGTQAGGVVNCAFD
jgi:general secretion pathway protein D